MEAAGIAVIRISGGQPETGRGGPRCMSRPLPRDEV
ncbi:arginine deiminase family protein [Actinomadura sp. GC306]|nr:arginine deiminase family protein [Actinomadura sp. GC306]